MTSYKFTVSSFFYSFSFYNNNILHYKDKFSYELRVNCLYFHIIIFFGIGMVQPGKRIMNSYHSQTHICKRWNLSLYNTSNWFFSFLLSNGVSLCVLYRYLFFFMKEGLKKIYLKLNSSRKNVYRKDIMLKVCRMM